MAFAKHILVAGCSIALCGCGSLAPIPPQEHAAEANVDAGREAFGHGRNELAIEAYAEALAYFQSAGNVRATQTNLLNLAVVHRAAGRAAAARACLDQMDRAPRDDSPVLAGLRREADWLRAVLAIDAGRSDEARRHLDKSAPRRILQPSGADSRDRKADRNVRAPDESAVAGFREAADDWQNPASNRQGARSGGRRQD